MVDMWNDYTIGNAYIIRDLGLGVTSVWLEKWERIEFESLRLSREGKKIK